MLRKEGMQTLTKRSRDWFIDLAMGGTLKGSFKKLVNDPNVKTRTNPMIGKMYFFKYDPKYKTTLPYYDRYPLIILADRPKKGKGFYGMNLHYLSPLDRAKLLGAMYPTLSTTGKELKPSTRLRISYGILKAASRFRLFKPTFKRYLPDHIKSQIVEIPAEFWEIAMFMPTQKFVGSTVSTVWSESRKKGR